MYDDETSVNGSVIMAPPHGPVSAFIKRDASTRIVKIWASTNARCLIFCMMFIFSSRADSLGPLRRSRQPRSGVLSLVYTLAGLAGHSARDCRTNESN